MISVTSFKYGAFLGCSALEYIDMGDGVTTIEAYALAGCSSLQYVICRAITPPTLGDANAFNNTNNCPIYVYGQSMEAYKTATNWSYAAIAPRIAPLEDYEDGGYVPIADPAVLAICVANWDTNASGYMSKNECEAVTNLGTLFKGNTEITSFEELNNFTEVSELTASAFNGCTNLTSLNIVNIKSFRGNCLYGTAITKIIAPNAELFESSTCSSVSTLEEVFLGKNMSSIANYAIRINAGLHTIVCAASTPPTLGSGNFTSSPNIAGIYVPDESIDTYKAETNWNSFANKIKGISSLATDNPTFYAEIQQYL